MLSDGYRGRVRSVLPLGIGLALVQLAVVAFTVDRDGGTGVTLVWMAIPAVLTVGWAYARRDDPVLPRRVAYALVAATALQVVVYLALPGSGLHAALTTVLIVAMVFLMAAWSGSRGW